MTTQKKEAPLAEVPTQIVAQENQSFNLEALISQGIDKGMTVDTMERLLAMRKELKAEWAREQFNKAMAAFQSECPTIVKTKEVKTKSGMVAYKYAPIESIVFQVKDLLKAHGFSYSSSMEVLPDGVKVCVKVIHLSGHQEESCMQVPLGTKTDVMSQSQVTAAAQTFAKRYAFLNAFGIMTGDDDNDGSTIDLEDSKEEVSKPHAHDGNVAPSEKQLKLISDIMKQKGYTKEDIMDLGFNKLTGGKGGTASELIDWLFKAPAKVNVNGQEVLSQEEISKIPF